ncbi:MAG: DUF2087 domain-containing protein [Candidatus Eiseniibacteriota bacterium]
MTTDTTALVIPRAEYESRLTALRKSGAGTGLPKKQKDRWILLHALSRGLAIGEPCSERAVNDHVRAWLSGPGARIELDHVSLRRALVDEGFLERDGAGASYRASRRHERRVRFAG